MLILLTCTHFCRTDIADPPVPSGHAFDPETIREMALRAGKRLQHLGLKVIDDAATRLIAEKIIELSQHGVRGVATLHAMAVKEFKAET